jgi:hypothetical protein
LRIVGDGVRHAAAGNERHFRGYDGLSRRDDIGANDRF